MTGTKPQNFARQVGKLSPAGNGLQQALALGATAFNPLMAAVPMMGIVAKGLADRGTKANVDDLLRLIASGGTKAPETARGMSQDQQMALIRALLGGSVAATAGQQ